MKRSDLGQKKQYYMGSKTSRNLTGGLGDDTMVEQNGRYASSSFGKENEDVGRDVYRQRRTPPVQRRRKGHGNSSVNYKEQQKYRREVNNEKRRTPQKSAKQPSVDPNEYYTSPLKQKQDEATKALREYEKTLAKVDMQVQQYHEQEGQEDINAGSSYETTKALEKHRRNLERAHNMQRTPGMAPTNEKKNIPESR